MVYHVLQGGTFSHPIFTFQIGDEGFKLNKYGGYPEGLFRQNLSRMMECEEIMIFRNHLYSGELSYDAGIKEFFEGVYELPRVKKIWIGLDDESFVQELLDDLKMIEYSDDLQVTIAAYPGLLDEKTIRKMLYRGNDSPFSQERVIIENKTA